MFRMAKYAIITLQEVFIKKFRTLDPDPPTV